MTLGKREAFFLSLRGQWVVQGQGCEARPRQFSLCLFCNCDGIPREPLIHHSTYCVAIIASFKERTPAQSYSVSPLPDHGVLYHIWNPRCVSRTRAIPQTWLITALEFTSQLEGYEGVTAQCHNCGNWSAHCITRW